MRDGEAAIRQVVQDAREVQRSKLSAENIAEFLKREIKPREMLLSPILPTQGLVMLYSWRGVGKTHVALGIGYAVASGGKFLRWAAPVARRVLYVDGEMPAAAMQQRLAAIVAGEDHEPPDPSFFRLVTPDLQDDGVPDLSGEAGQAAVEELIADGCDLLILDNLSTLCRFGRENEAESWGPVQAWMLRLRRRGISVLLVHHAGKGGAQRGTSRREDVLDTVLSLRRPSDYHGTQGARFEVHYDKARGLFGDNSKPFEAQLTTHDDEAIWAMRDIEDAVEGRAAALFEEGLSVRDVGNELGISKSKAHRLKRRLAEDVDDE